MDSAILISALVLTTFQGSTALDLTQTYTRNTDYKECTTKFNTKGICVPDYMCNRKMEIEIHGVIDFSEARSASECPGLEWCCTRKAVKDTDDGTTIAPAGNAVSTTESATGTRIDTTTSSSINTTPSTTTATMSTIPSTTTSTMSTTPSTTTSTMSTTPSTTTPTMSTTPSTTTTTVAPDGTDGDTVRCAVSFENDCPSCVTLYNVEGDFWCMGTLIGSNVVLTTATCLLNMEDQNLFVRVPGSADPRADYLVMFRLIHPDYNSGFRSNDLALLTIKEVQWGPDGGMGACFTTHQSFGPDCLAAGVDDYNNIVLTSITVEKGSCTGRGNSNDTACGKSSGDCYVQDGAPIMCPTDNAAYVVMGIAKMSCTGKGSFLGDLKPSETWLTNSLKGIFGLEEKDFLYTLNY